MAKAAGRHRVLVVDDEEHITELVSMGLTYNGFEVERVASGRSALEAVERKRPDLIVLDVMLADLDGFEVARRLRQAEGAGTRVPVIFLTARDTTQDKVAGLRLGSDDYVTKPFSIEELIERVKAVLRRSAGAGPGERRLSYADLELDEDTRDVWRAGRLIELTPPSTSCCTTSWPTPAGCSPGTRSSSASGTTPSPATPACSRPTSATCAIRSTASTLP